MTSPTHRELAEQATADAIQFSIEALTEIIEAGQRVKDMLDEPLPIGEPVHPASARLTWPLSSAILAKEKLQALSAAALEQQAVPQITPAQAMDALKRAFVADPNYAWSWHCAVWAAAHDEGMAPAAANRAAARLMFMAFDVDTSKHENFADTQAAPTPDASEPAQAEAPSELGSFGHRCPAVTGHRGGVFVCQSAGHGVSQDGYCEGCTCPAALATHTEQAADREDAYKAGWIQAAKWADRTDLISDIGSPAYERDRRAALARGEKA